MATATIGCKRGGFGRVTFENDRAIKRARLFHPFEPYVICSTNVTDAAFAARLAQFKRPSIRNFVQVHRVSKSGMDMVIEMEQGVTSLEDIITKNPRGLGEAVVSKVTQEVSRGLYDLHHQGLVHCDLKPDNIILTKRGDFNIIDFGSIRPVGAKKTDIVYTYDYAAPEILSTRDVIPDAQMDAYSLGCIMHACMYGKTFGGWGLPKKCPEGYSTPELYDIMCALLNKDPTKRMSITAVYYAMHRVIEILEDDDDNVTGSDEIETTTVEWSGRDQCIDAIYCLCSAQDRMDALALTVDILDRMGFKEPDADLINAAYILACTALVPTDARVEGKGVRDAVHKIVQQLGFNLYVDTVDKVLMGQMGHPSIDYKVLADALKKGKGSVMAAIEYYTSKKDYVSLE